MRDPTPVDMSCEIWMEAVSALHDGEDPPVERSLVRLHLERCERCRSFERGLSTFRRSEWAEDPAESTSTLRRRLAAADRTSRPAILRALLAFVAAEIFLVSLQPLMTGSDVGAASHPVRHIGAFTLAYAAAMFAAVLRPSRAGALLPVAAVLVVAIGVNVALDLLKGSATLGSEWTHLPELGSVMLLWLMRKPRPRARASEAPEMMWLPGASLTWSRLRRRPRDTSSPLHLVAEEKA